MFLYDYSLHLGFWTIFPPTIFYLWDSLKHSKNYYPLIETYKDSLFYFFLLPLST